MELTRFSEMLITAYQSIQCKITDDYICQDSLVAFWLALPLGSVDDTVLSHQMLRDNVGLDQPSLTTVGKLKKKKINSSGFMPPSCLQQSLCTGYRMSQCTSLIRMVKLLEKYNCCRIDSMNLVWSNTGPPQVQHKLTELKASILRQTSKLEFCTTHYWKILLCNDFALPNEALQSQTIFVQAFPHHKPAKVCGNIRRATTCQ